MKSVSVTLLSALFVGGFLLPVAFADADIGSIAPDFTLIDVDGRSFSLSDFRGTTVVLTFMASRCVMCMLQIRMLVNVSNYFGDDITVIAIGVSSDDFVIGGDTDDALGSIRETYGVFGILARDTDNVVDLYGVRHIPTMFIMDSDGRVRRKHVGVLDASEEVLLEELPGIIPEFHSTATWLVALILSAVVTVVVARANRKSVRLRFQKVGV